MFGNSHESDSESTLSIKIQLSNLRKRSQWECSDVRYVILQNANDLLPFTFYLTQRNRFPRNCTWESRAERTDDDLDLRDYSEEKEEIRHDKRTNAKHQHQHLIFFSP